MRDGQWYAHLEAWVEIVERCQRGFEVESKGIGGIPPKLLNTLIQHILVYCILGYTFLEAVTEESYFFYTGLHKPFSQYCNYFLPKECPRSEVKPKSICGLEIGLE